MQYLGQSQPIPAMAGFRKPYVRPDLTINEGVEDIFPVQGVPDLMINMPSILAEFGHVGYDN